MNILFIGDIFASAGRNAVAGCLQEIISSHHIDLAVANAENAAGGFGLTPLVTEELLSMGLDVLTSGNHIWDKEEAIALIERDQRVVRPVNFPPGAPGRGFGVFTTGAGERLAVVSVLGRIFMTPYDCPFRAMESVLEKLGSSTRVIFVDFHAEATSEKMALAWYLDGRVSAIVGTHTHVQTADERIFPRGTAYLTDAGMTGPHDSVIGVRKELALRRLMQQMPVRYQPADADLRLHGILIEVDAGSGRATSVERIGLRLA